ncbi:MAG: putative hydrogen peroxide-inducible genes activator [Alphaproteobacteria bacterium MarineAlpha6_Bin2]|nr:MAG: putative hydrogen peroxide-inducible genes activator [Alphaproteobacteria bacterium MarineAlpha6_Bin2]
MYHPTFKQLKYLLAVSNNLHFGKAAKECFVSQSTLSSGIQELEKLLNIKLIERTKRRVLLTPLGENISERSQKIIMELNDVLDYAKSSQKILSGETRLGIIPTIAPYILPQIMPKLNSKYPMLELKLIEDQTANILKMLSNGSLDLAIIAKPYNTINLTVLTLKKDFFYVAVPSNNPLAKKINQSINSHDISKTNMLLLDEGHCLRDHALEACGPKARANVDAFKATSLLTLVQMVASGVGITLLPEIVINSQLVKNTKIRILEYENKKNYREICICWRKSSPRINEFNALTSFFMKNL